MSWELAGRRLERVLISRLRYLGDVAMSTVVLEALRRGDPDLELGYLCEAPYAPLLTAHPEVARVHALKVRRRGADAKVRTEAHAASAGVGLMGTLADLRRQRYDLAVDLFFNPRSAGLLRLAGIPLRIGGTRAWRRRLYTHTVLTPNSAAAVGLATVARGGLGDHLARLAPLRHTPSGLQFLDWLAQVYADQTLRTSVAVPSLAGSSAAHAVAELAIVPGDRYVLLAPGATWSTKEWPPDHWRALACALRNELGQPLVLLTPPGREGAWDVVSGGGGAGGILPPLPLQDVLRLIGAAALLITVDGGVMHAAVAMSVPTLALFGPTDPGLWFPYEQQGPFRVLGTYPPCHPCDLHICEKFVCMPDLEPLRVAELARELLNGNPTGGHN